MTRLHLVTLASVLLWLGAGCTLINEPDRSLIPGDGGMDSMPDGDASIDGDAGDAGDATDDADACGRNEICTGREDEDCDFLIDCADPDCASLEECCMGGTPEPSPPWGSMEFDFWEALPSDGPGNYPTTSGGDIVDFPSDVQGILRRPCVPLSTGYRLKLPLVRASAACPEGSGCFAALVITPAPGAPTGSRILNDLAVTADETGSVVATNFRRELGRADEFVAEGQRFEITIAVTVGVDSLDVPHLLGTVTVENLASRETVELVTQFAFAPIASLIRGESDCEDVPGSYIAIEGAGSQWTVEPLVREPLECINAGRFDRPEPEDGRGLLSAQGGGSTTNLGWGEWADDGIGSPGLAVEGSGSGIVYHLVGDATNYDRTQDPVPSELGFGVGYSRTLPGDWDGDWTSYAEDNPKSGPCNPACEAVAPSGCALDMSLDTCPAMGPPPNSVRDPSFSPVPLPVSAAMARIAYARRESTDRYGIAIDGSFLVRTDAVEAVEPALIHTSSVPSASNDLRCTSLRDPVLVPVDPADESRGLWLFYSCYLAIEKAEIHAVRLTNTYMVEMDTHRIVAASRDFGDWAASSVWSPELVVEYEPAGMGSMGRHLYRLWFLARNSDNNHVSIGLLQGQLSPEQSMNDELPSFEPFGANPILTDGPTAFPDCPDCTIEGLAVVRIPNTQRVRFLIARLDNAGVPQDWHYAPFE
jgi:hypothetical protein